MAEKYIPLSAALSVAAAWCPDDDGSVGKTGDLREMLDELEALEPADVRPVVRGEWVEGYSETKDERVSRCSKCGHEKPRFCTPPFCEGCGADMMPEQRKEEK